RFFAFANAFRYIRIIEIPAVIHAPEKRLLGGWVNVAAGQAMRFVCGEFEPNLVSNGTGDLSFKPQHISEIAIISLSPQLRVCGRAAQLSTDPDPVTRPLHGSYDSSVHAQFTTDFGKRLLGTLISHGRGPRDYCQLANLRQRRDQRVRDSRRQERLAYVS